MRHFSWLVIAVILITAVPVFGQTSRASQPAEGKLAGVAGIDEFEGSQGARELLAKNGFVVTDRQFRQIFSAYIEPNMPKFITTDSAWHTYHVLLEEGVKRLEEVQGARLRNLSKCLLAEIGKRVAAEAGWNDLADFATVGLALQDEATAKALDPKREDLAKAIRTIRGGSGMLEYPIGLPLMAERFRIVSFYAKSRALAGCFAARQWYGAVDFRLASPRETALAVKLSLLIDGDPKLKAAYGRLTKVYDVMLGPPDDGDVGLYASVARKVLGGDLSSAAIDKNIEAIRKELASRLPEPKVNDQFLSPVEYARFAENTKGFRLLPSRQLACAVCFQNTVDPKVKGRQFPSGVDFFAACKDLRSPAALRALKSQAGKAAAEAIAAAECPPLSSSLHNQAMKLLAELQKPVPASAPAALRTEAWADKQLWTQLAAWAEQRHTWAAHAKLTVYAACAIREHPGLVSPYPEFFAGLGRLSSVTADAFAKTDSAQDIDARAVAQNLLDCIEATNRIAELFEKSKGGVMVPEELEEKSQKHRDYMMKVINSLPEEGGRKVALSNPYEEVRATATRVSAGGEPTEREKTLLALFDSTSEVADMLRSFSKVCDTLAAIARKQLAGQALTEADKEFFLKYGICLAEYHFYGGDSWVEPRDDFSMVTPVFVNPLVGRILYAGITRPQALYVIAPVDGKPVLHLGAVLSYREFHQTARETLDDQAWIDRVSKGQAPPPPAFTASFMRGITSEEIIRQLRAGTNFADIDSHGDRDITLAMIDILDKGGHPDERWLVEHLSPRCTEANVEAMIRLVGKLPLDVIDDLAPRIAALPWLAQRDALMKLLHNSDPKRNDAAAYILSRRPQDVDFAQLAAEFDKGDVRIRRLFCFVMGHQPKCDPTVKRTLLKALGDKADGVRWQAALAFANTGWGDADIFKALAACLNDKNEYVGAAAAKALVATKAPDAGALLLQRLAGLPRTREEAYWTSNAWAVADDASYSGNTALMVLEYRTYPNRTPKIEEALIEGIGELKYNPTADELGKWLKGPLCAITLDALEKIDPAGQENRLMGLMSSEEGKIAVEALVKSRAWDLENLLVSTALNAKAHVNARSAALGYLRSSGSLGLPMRLVALLEDKTVISAGENRDSWRICDAAAQTIAGIEDWREFRDVGKYSSPKERAELLAKARKWATTMPATMPG